MKLLKAAFLSTIVSCAYFPLSCPTGHRGCAHTGEDTSFSSACSTLFLEVVLVNSSGLRASLCSSSFWSDLPSVFGSCGPKNMACDAVSARGLTPLKHFYKQPDPVLYLLNMFPEQGTKDQMQLVTPEGKLVICIPRRLCLLPFSSFPSSPFSPHPLSR